MRPAALGAVALAVWMCLFAAVTDATERHKHGRSSAIVGSFDRAASRVLTRPRTGAYVLGAAGLVAAGELLWSHAHKWTSSMLAGKRARGATDAWALTENDEPPRQRMRNDAAVLKDSNRAPALDSVKKSSSPQRREREWADGPLKRAAPKTVPLPPSFPAETPNKLAAAPDPFALLNYDQVAQFVASVRNSADFVPLRSVEDVPDGFTGRGSLRTPGDGNCQFHALCAVIPRRVRKRHGLEKCSSDGCARCDQQLRRIASRQLLDRDTIDDETLQIFATSRSGPYKFAANVPAADLRRVFARQICREGMSGYWGDQLTLILLADAFRLSISVNQLEPITSRAPPLDAVTLQLLPDSEHYQAGVFILNGVGRASLQLAPYPSRRPSAPRGWRPLSK